KIKTRNNEIKEVEEKVHDIAARIPNIPNKTVPVGTREEDNEEVRSRGDEFKPEFEGEAKPHWDIRTDLGILDFDRGAKVAGARFVYYRKLGARLERAIKI